MPDFESSRRLGEMRNSRKSSSKGDPGESAAPIDRLAKTAKVLGFALRNVRMEKMLALAPSIHYGVCWTMAVELKVRLDGPAPGLAEHRLSLLSFGSALTELHRALRTAATRLETSNDPNHPAPQKKYSARARHLDVQVKSITDGCVSLGMDVVLAPTAGQLDVLEDDLAERTVSVFLDALKTNKYLAAGYLRELGPKVTRHSYEARRADGSPLVPEFSLGQIDLTEQSMPAALLQFQCEIAGVTFTPGKEAVILQDIESEYGKVRAAATAAQVDAAISLRKQDAPIEARVFQLEHGCKLFSLRSSREARRLRSPDERIGHIMSKWSDLLHQLAQ